MVAFHLIHALPEVSIVFGSVGLLFLFSEYDLSEGKRKLSDRDRNEFRQKRIAVFRSGGAGLLLVALISYLA